MATYLLKDLIGKSYFAKTDTRITRLPKNNAVTIYTVSANQSVGTIYSYLLPTIDRDNVWLMFLDQNNRSYYVELVQGKTDEQAFQDQGVKSTEQIIKEETNKNLPLKDFIAKNLKIIVGIVVAGAILKEPLKNIFK